MSVSNNVTNNDMGRITVKDGSPVVVSHVCAFDNGDMALTGMSAILNNTAVPQRRGKRVGAPLYTDRKFPQFSFSSLVTDLAASPGTIGEMLLKSGNYVANISTFGTSASDKVPVGVDLVLDFQDRTGAFVGQLVLEDCEVLDVDFKEAADGNTLTATFRVLGNISGDLDCVEIS